MPSRSFQRRRMGGFSLIEMMVAMAIGLLLIAVFAMVYLNSRSGSRRVDQMSAMQQSVRTAFEHFGFDARMAGHVGCFTGSDMATIGSGTGLADNFRTGVEGYEATGTGFNATITVTNNPPSDTTEPTSWSNSSGTGATAAAIPIATISTTGLTPSSDVLILRGPSVAMPIRVSAAVPAPSLTALSVDPSAPSTGSCTDGIDNTGGFCVGSYGVVASCTNAQLFTTSAVASGSLTVTSSVPSAGYAATGTEVFPVQTSVYYVRRSSDNTSTSLYRRVMDGHRDEEHELIADVENLQIRYAVDTITAPGVISGDYVTADIVGDWARVIAVRVSVLMRSATPVDAGAAPTSPRMNGVSFTLPSGTPTFERRSFTTTIALRNRIFR